MHLKREQARTVKVTQALIRRLMKDKNLSASDLAARVGMQRQNIHSMISGQGMTIKSLVKLGMGLGVHFEIVAREEDTNEPCDSTMIDTVSDIAAIKAHANIHDALNKVAAKKCSYCRAYEAYGPAVKRIKKWTGFFKAEMEWNHVGLESGLVYPCQAADVHDLKELTL